MRQAIVKYKEVKAGILEETDAGEYIFTYQEDYVKDYPNQFITFQMPVRTDPYKSLHLFPFFDGLIPEGWLLNIVIKSWKTNSNDRMGLLLAVGKDCIGAVSVHQMATEDEK